MAIRHYRDAALAVMSVVIVMVVDAVVSSVVVLVMLLFALMFVLESFRNVYIKQSIIK